MNPADLAVVVLSCDKYSDLWRPFFELFFRHWSDCPFPVVLFANQATYDDPRVTTVLSGIDPDWSTSVKRCLAQVPQRHVCLFFDDVFLDQPVRVVHIKRLTDWVATQDPDYLRFRRFPKPDQRLNADFGLCVAGRPYRTSVFGIWKREVLMDLMREGESAWDFEHRSVARSAKYSKFHGVYEEYFSYIHGVEKGLWIRSAVQQLTALGCAPDTARRAIMSPAQHRGYLMAYLRTYFFNRTPGPLKSTLLRMGAFRRKIVELTT